MTTQYKIILSILAFIFAVTPVFCYTQIMKKVYVIKKYVVAKNAEEAIRKERKQKVDDCWTDEKSLNNWIESLNKKEEPEMGFKKKTTHK